MEEETFWHKCFYGNFSKLPEHYFRITIQGRYTGEFDSLREMNMC